MDYGSCGFIGKIESLVNSFEGVKEIYIDVFEWSNNQSSEKVNIEKKNKKIKYSSRKFCDRFIK